MFLKIYKIINALNKVLEFITNVFGWLSFSKSKGTEVKKKLE